MADGNRGSGTSPEVPGSERTLSIAQVARYCKVNPFMVRRWIAQGHMDTLWLKDRPDEVVRVVDFLKFLHHYAIPIPQDLQDRPARVLIVEDEPQVARTLQLHLEPLGFVTHIAHNGFEAGLAIMRFRPHVITLDLVMPTINGWDLLKHLKQQRDLAHIRILVVSALPPLKLQQALAAGAHDFLAKPFARGDLQAKVTQLADRALATALPT